MNDTVIVSPASNAANGTVANGKSRKLYAVVDAAQRERT
jgi:hypothetical protein